MAPGFRKKAAEIASFLGPRVTRLLGYSVLVGILLFMVELALAYTIQAFLALIAQSQISLPHALIWLHAWGLEKVLALLFAIGLARGLLQWAQVYIQIASNELVKYQQRTRILSWAFQSESTSTALATTLFTERSNAAGSSILSLQTAVMQATLAGLLGIGLLYISPLLTVSIAIFLALLFFPMKIVGQKIEFSGQGLMREWDHVNSRLVHSIRNLLLMRIYGTQEEEEKITQEHLRAHLQHNIFHAWLSGFKFAIPQVGGVAVICLVTVFAVRKLQLPSGLLVSYFYLFVRFVQNFSESVKAMVNFNLYRPQLVSLSEWWEQYQKSAPKPQALAQRNIRFSGPIGWRLENVDFSYSQEQRKLFSEFTNELKPGSLSAIIGPSGAGKSTLLQLLLGMSEPSRGKIVVLAEGGEIPLNHIKTSLLSQIGYVGAESFLLEGTIRQNLLYGSAKNVSEAEINSALARAECHFVQELPNGLNHVLTEQGQGLSAGQKQRLSLARALLREPKALILDEATANLDMATEERLLATLAKLKGEMTIIGVTHRKAMMAWADKVIELG